VNALALTPERLADHPLPDHGTESNKDDRGTALIVGGGREVPGGLVLAGLAALRAGAGTLQLATVEPVAVPIAMAVPEARVVALPADEADHFTEAGCERLAELAGRADAVLIGTSTLTPDATDGLLSTLFDASRDRGSVLVIDAGALPSIAERPSEALTPTTVLMPNPVEMGHLLGTDLDGVMDDPGHTVRAAVGRFGCTVALRGAQTWVAAPGEVTYLDTSGTAGLAASGSGDVLGGLIAGYAARGARPLDALLWATHVHGVAGERCSAEIGHLGFFARELVDALPAAERSIRSGGPG
jgi:ADP-dependent NAD(P)H-hydrate dehydratase